MNAMIPAISHNAVSAGPWLQFSSLAFLAVCSGEAEGDGDRRDPVTVCPGGPRRKPKIVIAISG